MPCRCLLYEAGEKQLAENTREYINTLGEDIKAEKELYQRRLNICGKCAQLLDGTCLKCGCYVEMRAAVKRNRCPSENKYW